MALSLMLDVVSTPAHRRQATAQRLNADLIFRLFSCFFRF
jgi:hypothetical protein